MTGHFAGAHAVGQPPMMNPQTENQNVHMQETEQESKLLPPLSKVQAENPQLLNSSGEQNEQMDNESESKPILAKSLGLVHSATKEVQQNHVETVEEEDAQKSFVEKSEDEDDDRNFDPRSDSKHEQEQS